MRKISWFKKRWLIKFISLVAIGILLTLFLPVKETKILANERGVISQSSQLPTQQDIQEIQQLIIQELNFPTAVEVKIDGILIEGNYGMADWLGGHVAGMMFFQKTNGSWQIIGGAGGVPDLNYLLSIGIPQQEAEVFMYHINNPRSYQESINSD